MTSEGLEEATARWRWEEADPLAVELDPRNPRLALADEDSPQSRLIDIMLQRFKVEELAESILSSGYNSLDPLVGYKQGSVIRVLEGNRRIAAIKCLLDPSLAPESSMARWQQLHDQLGNDTSEQIENVRVLVYANKDDPELLAYIGFRHVTGVLTWPALEKAKYIARLTGTWDEYDPIAKRVGSKPRHVERHFVAYQLVRQASDEGVPGTPNMEGQFGVLLRAMQTPGIVAFLGVTFPGRPSESLRPVPEDHLDQLKEFVEWTFGTEDRVKLLPESRQITEWGQILDSSRALSYLRSARRPDFERAYFLSGGEAHSIADALVGASFELAEVVPRVSAHVEDPSVSDAVSECTRFLAQILEHFPAIAVEYGFTPHD